MLKFQDCQISISGQTILAETINISEQNSIAPIYAIGHRGIISNSPNGPINNTISFDYILETTDVNYQLIQNIRNYNFNDFPVIISVGGISGMGYPSSFSLSVSPNDVVKASVSYNIYSELSGSPTNQPSSNYLNYNLANGSGIGHFWTTYLKTSNGTLSTGAILECNYSFNAEWSPKYKIGSPTPIQVKFLNGQEQFTILSEYQKRILYSGQTFTGKFPDYEIIEINSLSDTWGEGDGNKISLYPSSGIVTNTKMNIADNNIIVNESNIVKYY